MIKLNVKRENTVLPRAKQRLLKIIQQKKKENNGNRVNSEL